MSQLGVETAWEVVGGDAEYFAAGRAIQAALQGAERPVSEAMRAHYVDMNARTARKLGLQGDLVVVHDALPLSLVEHRPPDGKWVWRCHADVSAPQRKVWKFVRQFALRYDAAVFSLPRFAARLPVRQFLIYPSIDPLSERNRELSRREVAAGLARLGVSQDKPILLQVGPFDALRDPLGVVEAYRLVRRHHDVRLVLAGAGPPDGPDGPPLLAAAREAAAGDPDIVVLDLPADADLETNVLQRAATVVLQKSIRDGAALTVAEAMWKGKPVVGGNTGGIAAQVVHDATGYLVNSVAGAAYAVRRLLSSPELVPRLGAAGREQVRRGFLVTRHLGDYLALLAHLTGG
jgi:trehalose synthase